MAINLSKSSYKIFSLKIRKEKKKKRKICEGEIKAISRTFPKLFNEGIDYDVKRDQKQSKKRLFLYI